MNEDKKKGVFTAVNPNRDVKTSRLELGSPLKNENVAQSMHVSKYEGSLPGVFPNSQTPEEIHRVNYLTVPSSFKGLRRESPPSALLEDQFDYISKIVDGVDIEKDREILKVVEPVQKIKLTDEKLKEIQKTLREMSQKNVINIQKSNQVVVGDSLDNKDKKACDLPVIAESSGEKVHATPEFSLNNSDVDKHPQSNKAVLMLKELFNKQHGVEEGKGGLTNQFNELNFH